VKTAQSNKRIHYIPINKVEPGMILGAHLVLTQNGVMRFNILQGHTLTGPLLDQLRSHHAEIVCVEEPDDRSQQQREADWLHDENTLKQVFQQADLHNHLIKNLYDSVLAYRRRT
jgi:hypothetical protein